MEGVKEAIRSFRSADFRWKAEVLKRKGGGYTIAIFRWFEERSPDVGLLASFWAEQSNGLSVFESLEDAIQEAKKTLADGGHPVADFDGGFIEVADCFELASGTVLTPHLPPDTFEHGTKLVLRGDERSYPATFNRAHFKLTDGRSDWQGVIQLEQGKVASGTRLRVESLFPEPPTRPFNNA